MNTKVFPFSAGSSLSRTVCLAAAIASLALQPGATVADLLPSTAPSAQAAAPLSILGAPGCAGDIEPPGGDGIVDQDDFPPFVFAYDLLICGDPPMPVGCPADFDGDGFVDDNDFIIFVHAYNDYYCR